MTVFELRKVTFGYSKQVLIIKDVDLKIARGDFILLKGSSGSGKTTFLRLLNGLIVPLKGEILFEGKPLDTHDLTLLRRRVVYLQQTPVMLNATVKENLQLPFRFKSAGKVKTPDDEELRKYFKVFLLEGVSPEDNAQNLSVGQKQRLALIRALLLKPELLLLDEPTASLDQESRLIVEKQTQVLNSKERVGIIMVSHTEQIIQHIEPRVLYLERGVLKECL
jgi:putative ABC transport system ATP-binding protein